MHTQGINMQRLLAALAACLPAFILAAPAGQPPSFMCSAGTVDAYGPGNNWYCDGDLTIVDGTLVGGESLIFLAKNALTLKNVHLQAGRILFSAASISIDADSKIEAGVTLTASDALVPSLALTGLPARPLSTMLVDGSTFVPQPDLTRLWYDSHAVITVNNDFLHGILTWTVPAISLVPEPGSWQLAALGAAVLAGRRLRRA